MAFAPTTPVTGAALTGLTSPTYTLSPDTAPTPNSKQFAVTQLGGTQTGATAHSVSSPFTLTMFKPQSFKVLGTPNSAGVIRTFPKNTWELLARKGMTVLANQPIQTAFIRTSLGMPAGADVADKINMLAMISCYIGTLTQIAQGLADSVVYGNI